MMEKNLKIILGISIALNLFLGYSLSNIEEPTVPQKEIKKLSDVDFFTEYYKVDDQILFLGDSWVAQGKWKELLNNPNIINRGEGGITTYQFYMKFNDLIRGKPKKVFLLLGVNDLEKDAPEEFIMENFHRVLYEMKAKSPLTKIYIINLFPINPELNTSDTPLFVTNDMINSLNVTLKNFTDTFGINYIDANAALRDQSGNIDPKFAKDGLHISDLGYEQIIPLIKAKLEED